MGLRLTWRDLLAVTLIAATFAALAVAAASLLTLEANHVQDLKWCTLLRNDRLHDERDDVSLAQRLGCPRA